MLLELAWLPAAPADFRDRLKALRGDIAAGAGEDLAGRLTRLATHALDLNQLVALAKAAGGLAPTAPGLRRVKLGILGDGTQDMVTPAIIGSGLRHGLGLEIVAGDYGGMVQQALNPASPVRAAHPDFVLIAPDYRALGLEQAQLGAGAAEAAVSAALATLKQVAAALAPSVSGGLLVQTLVPPPEPLFGSLDAVQPGSVASMVAAVNRGLAEWAATREVILLDAARAAQWVGLDTWVDPVRWHTAKLPCSLEAVPLYADIVARTLAAATIGPRKCLVLDLDNTLWGGVIGDDGVEGIALGQGSGPGEAFLAIQRLALELRSRGVVLAVCSKNEEAAALLPFREHPEMLLKEADIAVFQANWTDKATNLRAIATALNIGVDALVFLDDNPAERAQVRLELPMVAVPELPADPALYPRALACAGYFETIAFLEEDRLRADAYAADAARRAIITANGEGGSDIAGYLASLGMVCDLRPFDGVGRARISQLINKSNQYNLTTRRYTEAEVGAIEADAGRYTLQVRLVDRFGDNGMISVIVFDRGAEEWVNDTWLMSCRVLGRRVEEAALAAVAAAAKTAGAKRLVGLYLPSPKNKMVADHYQRLGFSLADRQDDGTTRWVLDLDAYSPPDLPMQMTGAGAAA